MSVWHQLITCCVVCFFTCANQVEANQDYREYSDRDWNVRFTNGCGHPRKDSITRVRIEGDRWTRAELRPGDIGKCQTDNRNLWGQIYMERAELSQKDEFKIGSVYELSWKMIFEQGYTGKNETFFQVHSQRNPCLGKVIVQMRMHYGKMTIDVTRGVHRVGDSDSGARFEGKYVPARMSRPVRISELYGKELSFRALLDFTDNKKISLWMNEELLVDSATLDFAPCARPYLKFGVYRPGPPNAQGNGVASEHISSVLYDDIRLKRIK